MFSAWREFKVGKTKKIDVLKFELNLEGNIFALHQLLKNSKYIHDEYYTFYIKDPKLRRISKASVRDRVLHQAIYRILKDIIDKNFIFDSFSSRIDKGTHKGVDRLNLFIRKATKNYNINEYYLKCDIKKFFDSISHKILFEILGKYIENEKLKDLLKLIINSFEVAPNKGIPLGNVTSQLFSNIYLNELDQFVKHKLKIKFYLRYCDDFVILDNDKEKLENLIIVISKFLKDNLDLELSPHKIKIGKIKQGVDFLGYVDLPHYRALRIKTKNRILKKIKLKVAHLKENKISKESFEQTIQSYFGILKHCNGCKITKEINKIAGYDLLSDLVRDKVNKNYSQKLDKLMI